MREIIKKSHLNVRRSFFTVRVVKQRTGLPREAVEPPSLEVFKSHLDTVLGKQGAPA